MIVVPVLATVLYNIPKFFEIVKCSDEEIYATMLKSYFESNLTKPKTAINNPNTSSYLDRNPADSLVPDSVSFHQYQNISRKYLTFNDTQTDQKVPGFENDNDKQILHYLSTTNNHFVINAMKLNSTACDLYGHRIADFRNNIWYIIIYQFFSDLVLVKIIPWFTVIVLNSKVIIASREFRKRRLQLFNKKEDAKGNYVKYFS